MSDFSLRTKSDVRRELVAARRARAVQVAAEADVAICEHAAFLAKHVDTVAAYVPLPNEPGGASLPGYLQGACSRLLLPVVRPDLDLDWAVYQDSLTPGPFGLREPPGPRLGPAGITSAELVLVPALAVDRRGVRLGRGGGSYDRALSRVTTGRIVALIYDDELVTGLPAEPHDVRVHAVLTPSGITEV